MILQTQASIPTLALSDQWTTLVPLLGILFITLGLLMMLRKRKHRSGTQPTAREQLERSKQKQRMQGDLEQLMVELEQLTKRFSAQLDAKSLHLEKLIDQADRRVAELKRLQSESHPSATNTHEFWSPNDPRAIEPSSKPAPSPSSTSPQADGTTDAARGANAAGLGASVVGSTRDADLTQRVYDLADQGLDAPDIARKLDEHVGKVELMLALRKA